MKLFVLSLLCLVLVSSSNVLDLDPTNFDDYVDGSKAAFVEFFAPWCGHCKNLAPEYEIVGDAFQREDSVIIAKVDADAHKDLGKRFGVSGFPTLKFFPAGWSEGDEPKTYSGGRTADDIVNYINQEAGTRARIFKAPSAVTVLDPSSHDNTVNDNKFVFVEYYAPWCGHCKKLAPTWEKLAGVFANEENVVIANLDADANKDVAQAVGVSGFPTLIYYEPDTQVGDGERYQGGRELSDLISFVNEKAGTKRLENGRLDETVGLNAKLSELASRFVAEPDNRDSIQSEAKEVVSGLSESEAASSTYYVKYMNVIQKRGDEWIQKEQERLERLLADTSVAAQKIDEFTVRKNILNEFA